MQYNDFLSTVKVVRMLYGSDKARKFFVDNIKNYESYFTNVDLFIDKC